MKFMRVVETSVVPVASMLAGAVTVWVVTGAGNGRAEGARTTGVVGERVATLACSAVNAAVFEPSEAVLISVTRLATSRLSVVRDSCVIRAAVDCSRLMATASAFEMLVTVAAIVFAAEISASAGTVILYWAKTFFAVVIIVTSPVITVPNAVRVGYLAKMF
jgi:hypothetical protein